MPESGTVETGCSVCACDYCQGYGHAYGHEYPGGRFWLNCAGLNDLRGAVLQTAAFRGLTFTPAELARPDECFARVKALFEQGPATLFILDNVDDPALLSPQSRRNSLPQGDHIHVLATSRLQGSSLQGVAWLPVDALSHDDALALLNRYRPVSDTPHDDEWKAAGQIVDRLGRHALALEVVAVYLAEHPQISYRDYYAGLVRDGIQIVEQAGATNVAEQAELSLHVEQSLARLLAPTLKLLSAPERLAVEFAALLPPDHVPLPWLQALVAEDYRELAEPPATGVEHPFQALAAKLRRLRLVVPGDDPRVGRMHRIMQDVIRAGMPAEAIELLDGRLFEHALSRAANMEDHWGPDCVWEVEPLATYVWPRLTHDDRRACQMAGVAAGGLRQIGRSPEARRLYGRALEMSERLARALPDDVTAQRDLSVSYNRLADLSLAEGDPVEARRLYGRGLEIRERLARALPDDVTAQRDLSISYERLADLSRAEGDPVKARRLYGLDLEIAERLAAKLPDDVTAQRDLWVSYNKLADLSRAEGDPVEARRLYGRGLEIRERLARALPDDVTAQRDLSISYEKLADLSRAEGDPVEARRLYGRALEIRERLARALPDDVTAQRDLSLSLERLADLSRAEGDPVEARQLYGRGLEIHERLARALPDDVTAQRDLSVTYNKLADLSRAEGDPVEARRLYGRGLEISERLARALPDDVTAQRDLGVSLDRLADLSLAEGDPVEARRLYDRGLEIAERLAKQLPRDVQAQRDLAVSFYQLGHLSLQTGEESAGMAMLRACFQQLESMLAAGMPLDPTSLQVHQQLAAAFGPHGGSA